MRPLRLQIEGFAAFRDPVDVDFSGVDLGAFVGPTGSGKSSVIDAMTFALYGQVARYDNANLVAPAIHSQATEAKLVFEFELGEARYVAARVVRRTKDGATTKEARLERLSPDPVVLAGRASEMGEAVRVLLGLEFERFIKTVVLPQGRFAAFLHDTPGSRLELLQGLLDTGTYRRMAVAARRSADAATSQGELLATELEGAQSDDDIAELVRCAADLDDATRRFAAATDEVVELQASIAAAEAGLAETQGAVALLAGVRVPAEVPELASRLEAAAKAVADAEVAESQASDALVAADAALAAGPKAAAAEQAIARHDQRAALADEVVELRARHSKGSTMTAQAVAAADALRAEIENLNEAAVTSRRQADQVRADLRELGAAERFEVIRTRRAEREQLATSLVDDLDAVAAAQASVETLVAEAETAELHHDRARTRRLEAVAVAQASGLVAALTVGDPCPVCHQVVDQLPDHDIDAEVRAADVALTEADLAAREAAQQLAAARQQLAQAQARSAQTTKRVEQLDAELATAPDADEIERALLEMARLTERVADADAAAANAEAALQARRDDANVGAVFATERTAVETLAGIEAKLETRLEDLEAAEAAVAGLPTRREAVAHLAQAGDLADAAATARRAADAARDRRRAAQRAHAEVEEFAEQVRAAFDRRRDELSRLDPPSADGSILERWEALAAWSVERLRAFEAEIDTIRRRHAEANGALSVCLSKAVEVARAVEQPVADLLGSDVPAVQDLASAPAEALAAWDARLVEAAKEATASVRLAEREKERLAAVAIQAAELAERAAVDRQLAQLLSGKGFEQWLAEEVLDDLVERATERLLTLSNGHYSLTLAAGRDIKIRDHHNADEVRDAKTLSGGETFLASLALALALADGAGAVARVDADVGRPIEALFLDEGFGTLDGDTLDTVATALEELGAAGRMVIIVTHIRELADRMPVRFEVTKGPTSSTVERVEV